MATRKLDQSQLELQAGAQGEAAVQRAHENRTRNQQRDLDRAEDARQFDESTRQRDLDRWSNDWQRRRNDRMARDADRAERQGKKRDTTIFGGQDTTFGGGGGTAMGDPTKREQFDEQNRQFDQSLELEGAKAGLTKGDSGQAPAGAALPAYEDSVAAQSRAAVDPRFAELQAEMKRGEEQMGRGLEVTRQGKGWRSDPSTPTGERSQREGYRAKSERINAVANYQRAMNSLRTNEVRALGAQTADAKKAAVAGMDAAKASLIAPLKATTGLLNRVMNNKGTKGDWSTIMADVQGPPVGRLGQMQQDAKSSNWSDELQSHFEQKISVQALKYIAATGELPATRLGEKEPLVDPSSEGMQKFFQHTVEAKAQLAIQGVVFQDPGNPNARKPFDAQQYTNNVKRVNRLAAWLTLNDKPMGMAAGGMGEAMGGQALEEAGAGVNPATPGRREALQPDYEMRQGRDAQGQPVTPPVKNITEKRAKQKAQEPVPYQAPEKRKQGSGQARGPYADLPGRMPLAGVQ